MDEIYHIAKKYGIQIIDDASRAMGATYKGKKLGSMKDSAISCFQINPQVKNAVSSAGFFTTNDEEIAEKGLQKVDLSYFFAGTLTDEDGNPLDEDATKEACTFYSDSYLPAAETDDEGNIIGGNRAVGMDFFCQFPDEYTLSRCAVMRDFGPQNDAVLKMWERFKSNALPVWAILLFVVEILAALGLVGYFYIGKRVKHSLRKKRKEEQNKK